MPELQELFDMRLAALQRDVEKVKEAANEASRRREMLDDLIGKIGGSAGTDVSVCLNQANAAVGRLTRSLEFDVPLRERIESLDLAQDIRNLPAQLDIIWRVLLAAGNTLTGIEQTMVQLEPHRQALEADLANRCDECDTKISTLRYDLRHGSQPRRIWERFEELLNTECQQLFADYVDLLGGLTLRDTALEDRVCDMTDTLLTEVSAGDAMRLLAVPARRATLPGSLVCLVKLGFPEWTIWNVPLAGHNIGFEISRWPENDTVISNLNDIEPSHSRGFVRHLFSDAIAAYAIGPAFSCAAMLMRFQPDHDDNNPDTPTDVERASVIFRTLQRMDDAGSFAAAVDKVKSYWDEAVRHLVGDNVLAPDPPWLEAFDETAFNVLERRNLVAPYRPEQWDALGDIKANLLAIPEPPPGSGDAKRPPAFRRPVIDLLNAAWSARLDEPAKADLIATNVKRLWQGRPGPRSESVVMQTRTQSAAGGRHGHL